MRSVFLPMLSVGALLAFASPATTQWSDNFDSYANNTLLSNGTFGGWAGWDLTPAAAGTASNAFSRSAPNSILIGPAADAVRPGLGATSGRWVLRAWQYIETGKLTAHTWVIINNRYNHNGAKSWSCQFRCNATSVMVEDRQAGGRTTAPLPVVFDAWVEWRLEIDLDANTIAAYYNGQLLSQGTYVTSTTAAVEIQNIDLFSQGATCYFDDISLTQACTMVVPRGTANTEGNASSNLPWGYGNRGTAAITGSRTMYAYDPIHFTSQGLTGPTMITNLRWRGNGGVMYLGGGKYGNVIITISTMPNPISTLANPLAFAGQHGADVVEVYKGAVDVGVLSGTTPNDWHINVKLQKTFTYDPSQGPLLVELAAQDATFTGPTLGAAGTRLDLSSTGSSGYNRMYDVNTHDAAMSSGTNECGAVMELTYAPVQAIPNLGTFAIPYGTHHVEGNSSSNLPWGYGNRGVATSTGSRTMYGYDASHFLNQGVDRPTTITRLRWRGNGGVTYAGGGKYGNVIITLSTMPNPISTLASPLAFAGQHGADKVEVYNGAVDVGALSGTTPNDWHIDVTLQKPFTYDPSQGPLLVELAAQDATFTGPSMGAAGTRLDLSSTGSSGYNRMYDVNAHDAAMSSGTNECGAVMEITSGLHADVETVSAKNGGTQKLMVSGTLANANKNYWIFGSLTGSNPGVSLFNVHIPLNPDIYTDFTISFTNTTVLTNFSGTLDSSGNATATFNFPSGIPIGTCVEFNHASVIYDAGTFIMSSGAVRCRTN